MRQRKPFGLYPRHALDLPRYLGVYMDVADVQDCLPQGCRIRNKKHKRRLHNKRTRQKLKNNLTLELTSLRA